jgi:hypothetical protein
MRPLFLEFFAGYRDASVAPLGMHRERAAEKALSVFAASHSFEMVAWPTAAVSAARPQRFRESRAGASFPRVPDARFLCHRANANAPRATTPVRHRRHDAPHRDAGGCSAGRTAARGSGRRRASAHRVGQAAGGERDEGIDSPAALAAPGARGRTSTCRCPVNACR